jgi:uncharacterized membrane protein
MRTLIVFLIVAVLLATPILGSLVAIVPCVAEDVAYAKDEDEELSPFWQALTWMILEFIRDSGGHWN